MRIGTSRAGCSPVDLSVLALALILSTSPASICAALAQQSQTTQRSFSIPAGSLSSALVAFGQQAGIQVSYVPSVAAGLSSPGVTGTMSAKTALSKLLAGTGLSFDMGGANTVVVSKPADGAGATIAGAIALDTIDVSGGGDQAAAADQPYQTPGSSAYISAEQIERVPPISAGDIFREVPGVMSGSNHNGTAVDVNIRGLQGMSRVKVMVDGTQQETSTYRGYAGPDNRSYVDPAFLGGVEIDKGPSAGPYGSGAIGGIVNMRTLEAKDLLEPGKSVGGRVRTTLMDNTVDPRINAGPVYDTNGFMSSDSWRGSVVAALRGEQIEFVAGYARREQGNYFSGKDHGSLTYPFTYWNGRQWVTQNIAYSRVQPGEEVPNTSADTTSAMAKARAHWDDGQSLEFGVIHYESVEGVLFPSNVSFRLPRQYPLGDVSSQRYSARYKWNPSDNDLLNLTVNVWGTVIDSKDPNDDAIGYRAINNSKVFGVDAWNNSVLTTSLGELRVTYGGEYSSAEATRDFSYPPSIFYNDVDGDRDIGGVFARGTLDLTSWLAVDAGLRGDTFRSAGVSRDSAGNYVHGHLEASGVSPSVGLTLKPLEGLQLFAKYSEGWRPPSMIETFGSGSAAAVQPNPNLRPEQSKGWEFGANLMRDGVLTESDRLRVKTAYFDNDYTDYLARGYANGVSGIPMFINIPGAKLSGVEGSISYDARVVFAEFEFNYFDNVEYCYNALAPGYGISGCSGHSYPGDWRGGYVQPKYSGSATLGTRLFDERLTLGARVNFFGESATGLPPWNGTDLPVMWAAEQIYDAFANVKLNENASLNFSVENLQDRYYVSPLAVAQIPSPGRTGTLTLDLKF